MIDRARTAVAAICAAMIVATAGHGLRAQPPDDADRVARGVFAALDADGNGVLTRVDLRSRFDDWVTQFGETGASDVSAQALTGGLSRVLPGTGPQCGGRSSNPQTPCPEHVTAMIAALPSQAPARPAQPRRVLVLARAAGFVHSSIPLAAQTVEELGKATGAWETTVTYDAADITTAKLRGYDAIFLASTTGAFLDDPDDAAATASRRQAFLDFVRSGRGLAGIHAATDAYHERESALKGSSGGAPSASFLASLGPGLGTAVAFVGRMMEDGDANGDRRLTRAELAGLADTWFARLDTERAGRLTVQQFVQRADGILPRRAADPTRTPPAQGPATELAPDDHVGTWPEFNRMIGGFFKFHWNDGQQITYRIDEPDHPLNAPFKGRTPFVVVDETYTFGRAVYSRENLRVLTSVDYDAMSAEDKAKEQFPRDDGDYALSWIRREGAGRVFYMAHGHNEANYANRVLLEHLLAGIQYAIGDLPADDSPSR